MKKIHIISFERQKFLFPSQYKYQRIVREKAKSLRNTCAVLAFDEKKFLYYYIIMSDSRSHAPNTRPKLSQIAKMAGSTPSTVSKVINGRKGVSEETRDRIEKVLSELNYSKPPVRHRTSTSIMLVVRSIRQQWIPDLLQGANDYAAGNGLAVAVCSKTDGANQRDDRYLQSIRQVKPLAIVFDSAYVSMQDRTLCQELQIDYAVIDPSGTPSQDRFEVRIDNWAGGWEVGRHLTELGHRKLGVISGNTAMACFTARLDGFRSALRERSVHLDDGMVASGNNWTEESRIQALRLLTRPDRPTAIFACSDTQAYGVYDAAHQLGLSIPRDLSVVGFDDIESVRHLGPPLTTVRQPLSEMVQAAFDLMLNPRRDGMPDKLLMPPTLVERGSTAPPSEN